MVGCTHRARASTAPHAYTSHHATKSEHRRSGTVAMNHRSWRVLIPTWRSGTSSRPTSWWTATTRSCATSAWPGSREHAVRAVCAESTRRRDLRKPEHVHGVNAFVCVRRWMRSTRAMADRIVRASCVSAVRVLVWDSTCCSCGWIIGLRTASYAVAKGHRSRCVSHHRGHAWIHGTGVWAGHQD